MLNLIKLELKKFKIRGSIRGAMIANLVILGFIAIINFGERAEGRIAFNNYVFAFSIIDSLVKSTFIIFASALIAKYVIEEYKSKTIMVLFMYPINRKKLIISKLLVITIFTFVSIVISEIFIGGVLCLINNIYELIPDKLTITLVINNLKNICINALAASGMSLIPLYFGMKKKSVPTTIISSILIVSIVCGNNGGFSLSSIIAIPLSLAVIGIGIAYLSIRNIENVDLF